MATNETSSPIVPGATGLDLPWWGHVLLGLPAVMGAVGYGLQGKPMPSELLAPLQKIVKQQRTRKLVRGLDLDLPDLPEMEDLDLSELLSLVALKQKQPKPLTDFPDLVTTLIGVEPQAKPPRFPETAITPEEGLRPMYQPPDPTREAWQQRRAGLSSLKISPQEAAKSSLDFRLEEAKEGRLQRQKRAEALSRAKLELMKSKSLTPEQQQAVRTASTEEELLAAIPPGQLISVNIGGAPVLLEAKDAVQATLRQESGQPEIMKLQRELERLPAGSPRRKPLEARMERLTREPREPADRALDKPFTPAEAQMLGVPIGTTPRMAQGLTPKPPPSPDERKQAAILRAHVGTIDTLLARVEDPEIQQVLGHLVGNPIGATKRWLGQFVDFPLSETQRTFASTTAEFTAKLKHDLIGAAQTMPELKNLIPLVPEMWDPPGAFRAKLTAIKEGLVRQQQAHTQVLQQSGVRSPTPAPTPPGPDTYTTEQDAIDAYAKVLATDDEATARRRWAQIKAAGDPTEMRAFQKAYAERFKRPH